MSVVLGLSVKAKGIMKLIVIHFTSLPARLDRKKTNKFLLFPPPHVIIKDWAANGGFML
jgi:hypothetical protein